MLHLELNKLLFIIITNTIQGATLFGTIMHWKNKLECLKVAKISVLA
jgi:hypothetical protein